MEFQETLYDQNNLEKKNKVEEFTFFNFKTYYKVMVIRTVECYINIDLHSHLSVYGDTS